MDFRLMRGLNQNTTFPSLVSGVPFYRGKEIILKRKGQIIKEKIYISHSRYYEIINKYGKPKKGDILITAVGTIGVSYLIREEEFYFKDGNLFWLKKFKKNYLENLIYQWMQSDIFQNLIDEITYGSTQKVITALDLGEQNILVPNDKVLMKFHKASSSIYNRITLNNSLNIKLNELKNLILSRMSKIQFQQATTV